MPIPRLTYTPLPAVIPRRVSDTRTLGDLLRRQGEGALQFQLQRGQSAAQLWQQLGQVFSSYAQGRRSDQDQAAALELRKQEKEAAEQLKRDELAERKAEREEVARIRKEAEARTMRLDAEKLGTEIAESVGYGPMAESQVDPVLQSSQGGRVRYAFGPATAEGPELKPTPDQARLIATEEAVKGMGGVMGPNGSIHMPPRPPAPDKPPSVGSFEDYVTTKYGPRPSPAQIEQARRVYTDQGREAPAPPPPEGTLTPKQISQALQMANSLKAHPAYTDMTDIATGWQGVTVGLSQQNGFGDIAAINAFQRMIDPGATVREGDVHLLNSARSWMDTVLSTYPIDRLRTGDKLPPAVRARMTKTARELYEVRSKNYNTTIGGQYRKIADAARIPFDLIGSDFEDAATLAGETPPQTPAKPQVTRDANGKLIAPPRRPR